MNKTKDAADIFLSPWLQEMTDLQVKRPDTADAALKVPKQRSRNMRSIMQQINEKRFRESIMSQKSKVNKEKPKFSFHSYPARQIFHTKIKNYESIDQAQAQSLSIASRRSKSRATSIQSINLRQALETSQNYTFRGFPIGNKVRSPEKPSKRLNLKSEMENSLKVAIQLRNIQTGRRDTALFKQQFKKLKKLFLQ